MGISPNLVRRIVVSYYPVQTTILHFRHPMLSSLSISPAQHSPSIILLRTKSFLAAHPPTQNRTMERSTTNLGRLTLKSKHLTVGENIASATPERLKKNAQ